METHELIIFVFLIEHLVFAFKFVLAAVISDEPEWIVEQRRSLKYRVKKIGLDIEDRKLIATLSDKVHPISLLEEVLNKQHHDDDIAGQLVEKISRGCEKWIKSQSGPESDSDENLGDMTLSRLNYMKTASNFGAAADEFQDEVLSDEKENDENLKTSSKTKRDICKIKKKDQRMK